MATRVYFPASQAAPVTPPTPNAGWEHQQGTTRALALVPDASALATNAYTPDAADHLTNADSCHRQYVSPPLKAQTLNPVGSNTFKAQFQCLEALNNCNLFITLGIVVCSNDGSTVLDNLRVVTRSTVTELLTTIANRGLPATIAGSYTCADGDRLVIEVGLGGLISSGSGGNVGHNGSIRWGCDASSGDLPENETETGATFRPWLEFTQTIKWLGEAELSSAGVASENLAGTAVAASSFSSSGSAAASIDGEEVTGGGAVETDFASAGVAAASITGVAVSLSDMASSGSASDSIAGVAVAVAEFSAQSSAASSLAGASLSQVDLAAAADATANLVGGSVAMSDLAASSAAGFSVVAVATLGVDLASSGIATDSFDSAAMVSADLASLASATFSVDGLTFAQVAFTGGGTSVASIDGADGAEGSVFESSGLSTASFGGSARLSVDLSSAGVAGTEFLGAGLHQSDLASIETSSFLVESILVAPSDLASGGVSSADFLVVSSWAAIFIGPGSSLTVFDGENAMETFPRLISAVAGLTVHSYQTGGAPAILYGAGLNSHNHTAGGG